MKKEQEELALSQEIVDDCRILFDGRPFGFECGEGWDEVIRDAAYQMEMLNLLYYPKYRTRIRADQIKEKFGELRFYYTVVTDGGRFSTAAIRAIDAVREYLSDVNRFDYGIKEIVDVEPYDYDVKKEISEEKYAEAVAAKRKPVNVEYVKTGKGCFEITRMTNRGRRRFVPTRLRFLWHLRKALASVRGFLQTVFPLKDDGKTRICAAVMEENAKKIVEEAEKRCAETCEHCGRQIGTEWSPRCTTTGWIKNVCENCVKKSGGPYWMNGKLMKDGKILKTKKRKERKCGTERSINADS